MNTPLKYFTIVTLTMFSIWSCSNDDTVGKNNYGDIEVKINNKSDKTISEIVSDSEIVQISGEFSFFLAALEYTELVDFLEEPGQYTVFVPTDEAFIGLVKYFDATFEDFDERKPFDEIDRILGPGTVEDLLLYHFTEGRRGKNSLVPRRNYKTVETLLGASFMVKPANSRGMINVLAIGNTANIIGPDVISASNGIIHVIDTVLLPI